MRHQLERQMARAQSTPETAQNVQLDVQEKADTQTSGIDAAGLSVIVPRQAASDDIVIALDGYALSEATLVRSMMMPYLTMIVNVIEGSQLTQTELVSWLRACLRQRSFDTLSRREYVLKCLWEHPPPEQ